MRKSWVILTAIFFLCSFITCSKIYAQTANSANPQTEAYSSIFLLIALVILVIIVGFGVFKTFRGQAVFFGGYGDLFISLINVM